MDHIAQVFLVLGGLYAIVFIFTLLGSRDFWSRRTIIHNVPGTAAVLTVLVLLVMFWGAFWGKYAWPVFFGLVLLLIVAGNVVASTFSKKDDGQK